MVYPFLFLKINDNFEIRAQLAEILKDPIFNPVQDMKMDDFRQLTFERVKKLAEHRLIKMSDLLNL